MHFQFNELHLEPTNNLYNKKNIVHDLGDSQPFYKHVCIKTTSIIFKPDVLYKSGFKLYLDIFLVSTVISNKCLKNLFNKEVLLYVNIIHVIVVFSTQN